jgi:hypothetical protein
MMGMGGRGGMMGAGGGGGMQNWTPGYGAPTTGTRIHDYAPTVSSTYYQKEQWAVLAERYALTMEWSEQVNQKWAPIEEAKLHYHLAAMGAASMVPAEFQGALNPENIALEGRRLEQRAVDAYVAAQRDLVPPEIKENLMESARLAALRKTRLVDPDDPTAGDDQGAGAEGMEPGAGTGMEIVPAAVTEADGVAFERRVAVEYEALLRSYIMGPIAGAQFRTDYYPRDRDYTEDGRPVYRSVSPTLVWSDAPAATQSGGGMLGGMAGGPLGGPMPGMGGMMGMGRGGAPAGGRGGMMPPMPGGGGGPVPQGPGVMGASASAG